MMPSILRLFVFQTYDISAVTLLLATKREVLCLKNKKNVSFNTVRLFCSMIDFSIHMSYQ